MGVLVAAIVSLVVIAFTWPTRTSTVHDIPLALVGPDAQTSQVESALTDDSDTFDIQQAGDRGEAVRLIEERDVYGAIVLSTDAAPEVLTAPAASPSVAQVMNSVAAQLQAQMSGPAAASAPAVTVTEVVPLSEDDPSGAGLVAAAFPLVMGGMLGGIFLTFMVHGTGRRLGGLAIYAVAGGLALPAILQGWFGVLQGPYLENAAAFALALSSIAGTILGAATLVGRIGVSTGPVLFLLFANPISSAATPTSFLPAPWGTIGQWFPPGAGTRLIRDISYFPEVNSTLQWLILAGWTALGLVLMGAGTWLRSRRARQHHAQHSARTEHAPDPLTV
jgi:hypothetical protein